MNTIIQYSKLHWTNLPFALLAIGVTLGSLYGVLATDVTALRFLFLGLLMGGIWTLFGIHSYMKWYINGSTNKV